MFAWAVRGYANAVVRLRLPIIAVWVLAAAAATLLPRIVETASGIDGFVPRDNPAVATEIASVRAFGFPLISRTILVQRDPGGLSPRAQGRAALRALRLSRSAYADAGPIVGALPITNTLGLFPSSSEIGTTALTYLFIRPGVGFGQRTQAARDFAARHVEDPADHFVGVTGSIPARVEQGNIVGESLPRLELATLAAILLIVGLVFRSVAAPIVALGVSGIAYVLAIRLTGWAGSLLDVAVPSELEPLILALLLGVVTDYVIFFLSGMRRQLALGSDRLEAARATARSYVPIVTVAGVTVAAGTASLLVAESDFFRAFGPGMAMSIAVGAVVSVTLVPALLAVFGRALFWPTAPRARGKASRHQLQARGVRLILDRRVAMAVVVSCVAGLGLAAWPLQDMRLGTSFIVSLPASSEARAAAAAAQAGFSAGILSPSVLLLRGDGIADERPSLDRLDRLLERQPGIAGVVGPGDLPSGLERSVLVSRDSHAARYLIILDDQPLGAQAVTALRQTQDRLPDLLQRAGLARFEAGFGGDTALASDLVRATEQDLGRIAIAALFVNLLLVAIFLRALVAAAYLVACSVLALCAALGVMTYVFQDVLGHGDITFYVPFAAAVLLLSLGSDYNIFGVGSIWSRARDRPLRQAIIEAVPESTKAITAAGVTLAASFGMLALVPLRPFRELALVMAVGVLLDAVVVRSLLVPALLALVGRASGWPGNALRGENLATPLDDTQEADPDLTRALHGGPLGRGIRRHGSVRSGVPTGRAAGLG